jgi:hypothetical protein
MTSKKQKEEFYSKDETEEFVCGNYFLDEPFFMKDTNNNGQERENQNDNFQGNNNELEMNIDKNTHNVSNLIFFTFFLKDLIEKLPNKKNLIYLSFQHFYN